MACYRVRTCLDFIRLRHVLHDLRKHCPLRPLLSSWGPTLNPKGFLGS